MKNFHKTVGLSTALLCIMLLANNILGSGIGDLSRQFPLTVMPPGYMFGIAWGLIYAGLIVAIGSRWSQRVSRNKQRKQINYLFRISCILNIARLSVTYMGRYILSVIVLGGLLVTLYTLVKTLLEHKQKIHLNLITLIPFSLYLGWLIVAFFVLGLGQLITTIRSIELANSPVIASLLLVSGVAATFYNIRKTTPRTALLPVAALGVLTVTLLTESLRLLGIIGLVGTVVILIYIYKHRIDFKIK